MRFGPLAIHRLRHPEAHQPDILTARENAARYLAADITAAAADLLRQLGRPALTATDQRDIVAHAGDALVAATAIIELFDADPDDLIVGRLHHQHLRSDSPPQLWPFQLSTILSVTTGKLIARPAQISDLLIWMTGDVTVEFGTDAAIQAAKCCDVDLRYQYPKLDADLSFPAVPATADTQTVDRERPAQLTDWVAKIAKILGHDDPDPWLPVRQLPASNRHTRC